MPENVPMEGLGGRRFILQFYSSLVEGHSWRCSVPSLMSALCHSEKQFTPMARESSQVKDTNSLVSVRENCLKTTSGVDPGPLTAQLQGE